MKHGATIWFCASVGVVLCASTLLADSRYSPIVERNVFGLKPMPPPLDTTKANEPPPSNITLTGIITLGGKRALMTTPPTGGKPGVPATPESYILHEGERQGAIEVISIDEVNFVVKVRNAGQEQTLDFKNNGPKLAAGPPPTPPPGAPGAFPGQPGFNPGAVARPMPLPGATGMPAPMPSFDRNVRTSAGNSGTVSPNSMIGRPVNAGGFGQNQPAVHNLDPEQAALMLEVERERLKEKIASGTYPALPTTRYTPEGAVGTIPATTGTPGNPLQPPQ